MKQVAAKMDGFDRVFLEQYQKMLSAYQRFLNEYLNNNASSVFKPNYEYKNDENKKEFHWGDEVAPNLIMLDVARRIMTNAMMGSGIMAAYAGANTVSYLERQDYEMWKAMSKFNEQLSFLLYDKIFNGG